MGLTRVPVTTTSPKASLATAPLGGVLPERTEQTPAIALPSKRLLRAHVASAPHLHVDEIRV